MSALNNLPWISGLSYILVTINATQADMFEEKYILKPAVHLRWRFLRNYLPAES